MEKLQLYFVLLGDDGATVMTNGSLSLTLSSMSPLHVRKSWLHIYTIEWSLAHHSSFLFFFGWSAEHVRGSARNTQNKRSYAMDDVQDCTHVEQIHEIHKDNENRESLKNQTQL